MGVSEYWKDGETAVRALVALGAASHRRAIAALATVRGG
jgi:hypothetical protein